MRDLVRQRLLVFAIALIVIGAAAAAPAVAQRKLEWRVVQPDETPLKVAGSSLGLRRSRIQVGITGDYLIRCNHQAWRGNGQQLEAVLCALEQFNWSYRPLPVNKAIRDFRYVSSGEVDWGDKSQLVRRRGVMQIQRFRRAGQYCFGYFMLFGVNGESGEPNHQLRGFFCQGIALDDRKIEQVVDAIGYQHERFGFAAVAVDGRTVAAAAPATAATSPVPASQKRFDVPLTVRWDGSDRPLRGRLKFKQRDRNGEVTVSAGSLRCHGLWQAQSSKAGSGAPPQGSWSLNCSDGRRAAGSYTSPAPGEGAGTGLGSDLKRVSFAFGGAAKVQAAPERPAAVPADQPDDSP